jgi:esterase/lipase superfamily enzyme
MNALFYTTDRERALRDEQYGRDRSLPKDATGNVGGSVRILYGIAAYDPAGNVTVTPCFDQTEFIRELGRVPAPDGILVYTHGYHNSFHDAIIDAGWLRDRLVHGGPVVLFSFPAQTTGGPFDYTQYINDETQATWSTSHFRAVLNAVHAQLRSTQFTFLSHSMGARFLAEGLRTTADWRDCAGHPCLRNAAVFAGDIDTYTLRDAIDSVESCDGLPSQSPAIVVYTSRGDWAVEQSQTLHGHSRAGRIQPDGHEMFSCGPVQTIDVSKHATKAKGHWYYQDGPIIDDLRLAFAGKAANDTTRTHLCRRQSVEDHAYYEFVDTPPCNDAGR